MRNRPFKEGWLYFFKAIFQTKIYGKRSADRRKEKERHLKVVGGEV